MNVLTIKNSMNNIANNIIDTTTPYELQILWKKHINNELSIEAANTFIRYYRDMRLKKTATNKTRRNRRNTRSQRGGNAPVTNVLGMTPGMPVATYGNFPTEFAMTGAGIRDLDVFFRDSMPISPSGYWPSVPSNMGSNEVPHSGGAKKKYNKKTLKRGKRVQRGGDLLSSLVMRPMPYLSSAPPNPIQVASHIAAGNPLNINSSPVAHTWQLQNTSGELINPGVVSSIDDSFTQFANPAPWQS